MFLAEMSSMKERMSHSVVSSVGAATSFAAGGDRRRSLRSSVPACECYQCWKWDVIVIEVHRPRE